VCQSICPSDKTKTAAGPSTYGEGGKLPPQEPWEKFPQSSVHGIVLARNLVFSRRKLAPTYYVEHDMFCCILKLQFWNLFFYPLSVKIMLKMHQKSFGGRAVECSSSSFIVLKLKFPSIFKKRHTRTINGRPIRSFILVRKSRLWLT